ncbi:hypothetical protein [Aurantimonas sp. A3-2-R12]|uniref:hypothetical protein n=1 Tax=Aurantimonas sp. A3-2-R12 TaxID=3114362 RepID=UPI002E188817|nr:hypothetical protein [Aurantimonas sp. A3-2-R12]
MHASFIVSAVASVFAVTASAAPLEAPYVLSVAHADFLTQLEEVAGTPGQIGGAARTAADRLGPHIEAEERVVLPFLGLIKEVAEGKAVAGSLPTLAGLQAELPLLINGQVEVVGALVDLFAAAEAEGRQEVSRLADQMIWHEMTDIEVLYPAAVLVNSSVQASMIEAEPAKIPIGPGPLYGQDPVPMMGMGNPHAPGAPR